MPARAQLSVCCMTVDPAARVAGVLGLLRGVADEVVVAVDDRVDPDTLGPVREVADRVLPFTFRAPVDRPRAWLAAQCTGEWLLTIDGDEVPSPALVEALPELLAATDVQQYHLPRRWLYPSTDRWLAELPWWPDFQLRLARNDATLEVQGGTHAGIAPVLPSRHLELPLYHLDLLLRSTDERAAKAAAYEVERPGQRAYGGGPLNETLYLPERRDDLATAPVPPDDRASIDLVLHTRNLDRDGAIATRSVEISSDDDLYRVELEPFDTDRRFAPGETRPFYLRVGNRGSGTWPWGLEQHPEIRVSYHWRTTGGEMVQYEGLRSPLPCRLGPGESTIVPTWVEAPTEPGEYVLEIDLVHEHVRWFEAPLSLEVKVGC